jgi:hypothetical protein
MFKPKFLAERVNHKPILKTEMKNVTELVGGNVTFSIEILSDYHRSIQWIKSACKYDEENDSSCRAEKVQVMEENEMHESRFLFGTHD